MNTNIWILNHYASDMYFDQGGRHYNFAKYLRHAGYAPVIFGANSKHGKAERFFETDALWEEHIAEEIGFVISVIAGEQDRIDIAQAAAQQLRDIGINCTVDIPAQMDWGGQMACLIGWGSPFDADDHTYKVFGTDKGANYSGYSNAAVDSYLKLARETSDPEQRRQYYAKFQEALAADPAYAFICYIDANYVASSRLHGISTDTVMGHHGVGIFWNVETWTLD